MAKRLILSLLLLGTAAAVHADEVSIGQTRRLIEQGEILPLEQVIDMLQRQWPGHAIEVELEREDGVYLYEIEWLDPAGRVWELDVDARSGKLLERDRDD
jgi:uncharacterized membrane protein YkoI